MAKQQVVSGCSAYIYIYIYTHIYIYTIGHVYILRSVFSDKTNICYVENSVECRHFCTYQMTKLFKLDFSCREQIRSAITKDINSAYYCQKNYGMLFNFQSSGKE